MFSELDPACQQLLTVPSFVHERVVHLIFFLCCSLSCNALEGVPGTFSHAILFLIFPSLQLVTSMLAGDRVFGHRAKHGEVDWVHPSHTPWCNPGEVPRGEARSALTIFCKFLKVNVLPFSVVKVLVGQRLGRCVRHHRRLETVFLRYVGSDDGSQRRERSDHVWRGAFRWK